MLPDKLSRSTIFVWNNGKLSESQENPGAPSYNLAPDTIVDGKYKIVRVLGVGGMGAVFQAHHLSLNRDVALKTFSRTELTTEDILRFQREARALAKLSHKNVVQVFDYGMQSGGIPYYTMECLQGESLADRIGKRGALPLAEVTEIFEQVCAGLAYVHSKGIVHRDLKPANIFIELSKKNGESFETVKLVDFGIAAMTAGKIEQKLTAVGEIFGSPLYMSPEQGQGLPVTVSSDSYSIGCALFEALTGFPPFKAPNAVATILLHQTALAPRLADAAGVNFPERIEGLVAKLLIKDPHKRISNLDLVQKELSAVREHVVNLAPLSQTTKGESFESNAGYFLQDSSGESKAFAPEKPRNAWPTIALALGTCLGAAIVLFPRIAPNQPALVSKTLISKASVEKSSPDKAENSSLTPTVSFSVDTDNKIVHMQFPTEYPVGELILEGQKRTIKAQGRQSWPQSEEISFFPSENFLNRPANLGAFQAVNLCSLRLDGLLNTDKTTAIFAEIGKLSNLKLLDVRNGTCRNDDLKALYKLKQLKILIVGHTSITGAGLASMPQLKTLESLGFTDCENPWPALEILKDSSSLSLLYLDRTYLSPEDFKLISKIENLEELGLNETNMTNSEFSQLTALRHLKKLHASVSAVTIDSIKTIKTLKRQGLIDLKISSPQLKKNDLAQIRAIFPGAVVQVASGPYVLEQKRHSELSKYLD